MKTLALIALTILTSQASAKFDGFECWPSDRSTVFRIYNQTEPQSLFTHGVMGGRTVVEDGQCDCGDCAILMLSSPAIPAPNSGHLIYALQQIDLRSVRGPRRDERVLGMRLGDLKMLDLEIGFFYSRPVAPGTPIPAQIRWLKRNGQRGAIPMTCRWIR